MTIAIGESGVLPTAAAIIGAVENALSEFGVQISHAPIAPSDIVDLIHRQPRRPHA